MLTIDQKEAILRASGIVVPTGVAAQTVGHQAQPDAQPPGPDGGQANGTPDPAVQRARLIETLFEHLAMQRAARSLQAHDEVRHQRDDPPAWSGSAA